MLELADESNERLRGWLGEQHDRAEYWQQRVEFWQAQRAEIAQMYGDLWERNKDFQQDNSRLSRENADLKRRLDAGEQCSPADEEDRPGNVTWLPVGDDLPPPGSAA